MFSYYDGRLLRRELLTSGLRLVAGAACASQLPARPPDGRAVRIPLEDETGVAISGPHRFMRVSGWQGYQPTSTSSRAILETDVQTAARGTVSFWFTPLENIATGPRGIPEVLPLLSSGTPPSDVESMDWGVFWYNAYPQLLGKFAGGGIWSRLDQNVAPFVYAEKLSLRQGYWYHVAITWDRPAGRLYLYVNGRPAGHNLRAGNFPVSGGRLCLGNPFMVLRDLAIEDRVWTEEQIREYYASRRPARDRQVDDELHRLLDPIERPALDLERDASWTQSYRCSFQDNAENARWQFQPAGHAEGFRLETTAEGLLVKTPDVIGVETRMYLWSPGTFEGDQWIEYDFRLESPEGLALLVVCASGPSREEFIADHGVPQTGSMSTILLDTRNYHWEYVRRVEAMRTDVETQWVSKNPLAKNLHSGCIPRLEQGRWYRLRFVKAGDRLHGSIDGRTVFDVRDSAFQSDGPAYNFGRIALRQMYKTRVRYRNLTVYTRSQLAGRRMRHQDA